MKIQETWEFNSGSRYFSKIFPEDDFIYVLYKSVSVKFSLIESVICLFTVKLVNFH